MESLNYLAGILLVSVVLISIERQASVNPGFKIFGMSIKKIRITAYVSIIAYVILIMSELM